MKPRRHIMDFGAREECNSECGMRMRYPLSCGQHDCKYLKRLVTFDLWEKCPECGGTGEALRIPPSKPFPQVGMPERQGYIKTPCWYCNGIGETPKYWTPEEAAQKIKEVTGEDWEPDEYSVYTLNKSGWYAEDASLTEDKERVVQFFGQPAPPADYRVNESEK